MNTKTTPKTIQQMTAFQRERMERHAAICREWEKLTAAPAQNRQDVVDYLKKKYGVHSSGTIYTILKRARCKAQAAEANQTQETED